MEQVIRTYGVFLLEAVIFAALIGMLFWGITDEAGHRGVFAIAGAYQEEEAVMSGLDYTKYRSESEKSAPVIEYVWSGMLHVGEYSVDELLLAKDYRGERLAVELCNITDLSGVDRTEEAKTGDGRLRFGRAGVYRLKVRAVDAWNRTTTCEICIPVNGGVD